jgi:sterol desaturase/sphingolipid hydroxylase (fatty acid hydroxylase superfamily)
MNATAEHTLDIMGLRKWLAVACLLAAFELSAKFSGDAAAVLCLLGLPAWPRELLTSVAAFAAVTWPLLVAEHFYPATNSRREYARGAVYWLISLVAIYLSSKAAVFVIGAMGVHPWFQWRSTSASSALAIAFGILLWSWAYDFFYYWFHRAQHRFPLLWRFHRVHHSIEHMNCLNSYHHVLELLLRLPLVTLPLAMLLRVDTPQLVLLSGLIAAWGYYIHSDTRIHLGAIGYSLLADNRFHRVHHSTDPAHRDRNFAGFLPLWDVIFGTYQRPGEEFPAVGLDDLSEPATVRDYLTIPFKRPAAIR